MIEYTVKIYNPDTGQFEENETLYDLEELDDYNND